MGPQDHAGDAQHLHRREGLLTRRREEGTMFQKMSLMWGGLGKMDVALVVLGCVTAGALYAAFLM